MFILNLLPHGHQMSDSPNSSCLIKPHSFHRPFVSSCTTANLSCTSSPTQTTNHPLITLPILINHTPPINSTYWPLALCVNVGPRIYTFLNPFDHAQVRHFPPPILLVPTVGHHQTPEPTSIFQHTFNFHLKSFAPHVDANLLVEG